MRRHNGEVYSQLASSMDKMREISTVPSYFGGAMRNEHVDFAQMI
jgi:hypothetical protein